MNRTYNQLSILMLLVGTLLVLLSVYTQLNIKKELNLPIKIHKKAGQQDFKSMYVMKNKSDCILLLDASVKDTAEGKDIILTFMTNKNSNLDNSPRLELSFNQFQQLFASYLRFPENYPIDLKIGSTGVNPINAVIRGNLFGNPIQFKFTLPGPIKLSQTREYFFITVPNIEFKKPKDNFNDQINKEINIQPYQQNLECNFANTNLLSHSQINMILNNFKGLLTQ